MRTWLLALGAAMALAGCSAPAADTTSDAAAPVATVYATAEGAAPHFAPDHVPVHVGDSLLFKVLDGSHTVDFDEAAGLSNAHSGNLTLQTPFAVRFTQPGTFHYHCANHAGMVGTVTVS